MDKVRITRKLEIDAGHRLLNHEGKCRSYHGHRYVAEITCGAAALDAVGRVVDFSVVKAKVGAWLDEQWDHGMILQAGDPLIAAMREQGSKVFVLEHPPTAEHLTAHLYDVAGALLAPHGVAVERVRIYETPNCWADYP